MAAPRKYSEELRERATRMALEAIADPATKRGAIRRIAAQLDVHPEALRTWVRTAEVDAGKRPGVPTDVNERLAQLERENRLFGLLVGSGTRGGSCGRVGVEVLDDR